MPLNVLYNGKIEIAVKRNVICCIRDVDPYPVSFGYLLDTDRIIYAFAIFIIDRK